MSYNASFEWRGDSLIIKVHDLYETFGLSSTERSWKVANITDSSNPRMHFTFNAYKPRFSDMDPSQGYNYEWRQEGNSIYITVKNIDADYGEGNGPAGSTMVCHMQQGLGNNVVGQLSGYRPRRRW